MCVCVCVHRVRKDNLTSCNSGVNMEDVDSGAGGSSSLSHNRPSSITSNSLSLSQHRTRASPHRRRSHNAGNPARASTWTRRQNFGVSATVGGPLATPSGHTLN